MTADAKDKPKNKFRIAIEVSVNDDVNRKRLDFRAYIFINSSMNHGLGDVEVQTVSSIGYVVPKVRVRILLTALDLNSIQAFINLSGVRKNRKRVA